MMIAMISSREYDVTSEISRIVKQHDVACCPSPSPDSLCNHWFPPFISDDTPQTGLLASACFDLGERGEQVEEIEKRTERVRKRRRQKSGGRGKGKKEDPGPTDGDSTAANGGVGPDSKLEKYVQSF
nr:PREDICTED: uncharacterized protein LOC105670705 [Linepithema humile]